MKLPSAAAGRATTAAVSGRPDRPAPVHAAAEPGLQIPIVGIGASAGGLEALERFLSNVRPDGKMAFVVVQHLDPTHKGMLAELLQRATAMTVVQATHRVRIKPDHVYVIPPNKDMSLVRGALHLFVPRRRAVCGCQLISSFAQWRRGANVASASSFQAWARTAPWDWRRSSKKAE
jgi:chemotaxis response regulator CheB